MSFRAPFILIAALCGTLPCQAQEYSDLPLSSARRGAFIRGHADCMTTYTQQFEGTNFSPGDIADAALESCSSWMDDLKKAIPSYEDRDTAVAKIESRARRISIKQTLEARMAASNK